MPLEDSDAFHSDDAACSQLLPSRQPLPTAAATHLKFLLHFDRQKRNCLLSFLTKSVPWPG